MPDLSLKASHDYWSNFRDQSIYRVVSFLESSEEWTFDGNPELEAAMQDLGAALEGIVKFELKQQADYVDIGNHVKSARVLRLMQAIDTIHPGSASKLLMYVEDTTRSDTDPAGLFLRRNVVFERLRLLGRIFSEERLNLLQKALDKDSDHA